MEKDQALFARNVGKLINYIFTHGYQCTLGEAFRTKEQALLDFKTCKGIKNSLHCHRLAIDINLFQGGIYDSKSESYEQVGIYWESLNPKNRWGGRFKSRPDGNHFEYHPGEDRVLQHGTISFGPELPVKTVTGTEFAVVLGFSLIVGYLVYKIKGTFEVADET
jgi:hypothetical protein